MARFEEPVDVVVERGPPETIRNVMSRRVEAFVPEFIVSFVEQPETILAKDNDLMLAH